MTNKNESLENIKKTLHSKIPFKIKGDFKLTKAKKSFGQAEVNIDNNLIDQTKSILSKYVDKHTILQRYNELSLQNKLNTYPKHFPVRMENKKGLFADRNNVFMYFPFCLELSDRNIENHFSFEFVENSQEIYKRIISPCVKKAFLNNREIHDLLKENIEEFTYLFSLFHELGHMVGPWQATPDRHYRLKVHWKTHAIMGELSADLLIAKCVPEFLELSLINVLGKIFFYSRKGFIQNRNSGILNSDNDAWGGAFILTRLMEEGVISFNNGMYNFKIDKLMPTLIELSNEIEELGNIVINSPDKNSQTKIIDQWMVNHLPMKNREFIFPEEVSYLFERLKKVPEYC